MKRRLFATLMTTMLVICLLPTFAFAIPTGVTCPEGHVDKYVVDQRSDIFVLLKCTYVYDSGSTCGRTWIAPAIQFPVEDSPTEPDTTEPVCTHAETYTDISNAYCSTVGSKKTFCKACGEMIAEEVLPVNDNHVFYKGSCLLCGATDPNEPPTEPGVDDPAEPTEPPTKPSEPTEPPTEPSVDDPTEPTKPGVDIPTDPTEPAVDAPAKPKESFFMALFKAIVAFINMLFGDR